MTELTLESKRELSDFLNDETGRYPELADLPYRWDRIPEDAMACDLPNYTERTMLLVACNNCTSTKPWAWKGLRRLLEKFQKRREPIQGCCNGGPLLLPVASLSLQAKGAAEKRTRSATHGSCTLSAC